MHPKRRRVHTAYLAVLDQLFRAYWKFFSLHGKCDALGGVEYRRVFREWKKAMRPDPKAFILRHANAGSG